MQPGARDPCAATVSRLQREMLCNVVRRLKGILKGIDRYNIWGRGTPHRMTSAHPADLYCIAFLNAAHPYPCNSRKAVVQSKYRKGI